MNINADLAQIIHNRNDIAMSQYLNTFKNNVEANLALFDKNISALPTYQDLLEQANTSFTDVFNKTILFNVGLIKSSDYIHLKERLVHCQHTIVLLSCILDDKQPNHNFLVAKCVQYNITSAVQTLDLLFHDDEVKSILETKINIEIDTSKVPGTFLDTKSFLKMYVEQIKTKIGIQKQISQLHNRYLTIVSHLPNNTLVANVQPTNEEDQVDQQFQNTLAKRKKRLQKLKDKTINQVIQAVFPLNKVPFATIEQCKSKTRKEKILY